MQNFFRTYETVADKRAKAEKLVRELSLKGTEVKPVRLAGEPIAREFWGKCWCFHFSRLPEFSKVLFKGKSYIRNNAICHLDIQKCHIEAKVSSHTLCEIVIDIDPIPSERWKGLISRITQKIETVEDLYNGIFTPQTERLFQDPNWGIFPSTSEIHSSCSCNRNQIFICPHKAAIFYGIAHRIDKNPSLLFLLRDVNPKDLLNLPDDNKSTLPYPDEEPQRPNGEFFSRNNFYEEFSPFPILPESPHPLVVESPLESLSGSVVIRRRKGQPLPQDNETPENTTNPEQTVTHKASKTGPPHKTALPKASPLATFAHLKNSKEPPKFFNKPLNPADEPPHSLKEHQNSSEDTQKRSPTQTSDLDLFSELEQKEIQPRVKRKYVKRSPDSHPGRRNKRSKWKPVLSTNQPESINPLDRSHLSPQEAKINSLRFDPLGLFASKNSEKSAPSPEDSSGFNEPSAETGKTTNSPERPTNQEGENSILRLTQEEYLDSLWVGSTKTVDEVVDKPLKKRRGRPPLHKVSSATYSLFKEKPFQNAKASSQTKIPSPFTLQLQKQLYTLEEEGDADFSDFHNLLRKPNSTKLEESKFEELEELEFEDISENLTPRQRKFSQTQKETKLAAKRASLAPATKKATLAPAAKKASLAPATKKASLATAAKKASLAPAAKKASLATAAKKASLAPAAKKA
ncbi:MAG: hypothetical protein LBF22_00780, partial [Deltaproteobacteria bacterium]|nr:hypothetical protein [Deltaproteobacteria bacterium]